MPNDHKIRAAWEAYHGGEPVDGYIPATPPTYLRGYRDGYAAATNELIESMRADAAEIRSILHQLDRLSVSIYSGQSFKECRDRLRVLVMEGK